MLMLLQERERFVKDNVSVVDLSDSTLNDHEIEAPCKNEGATKGKCRRVVRTFSFVLFFVIAVIGCSFLISVFILPSGNHQISTEDLITPELIKDASELSSYVNSEENYLESGEFWQYEEDEYQYGYTETEYSSFNDGGSNNFAQEDATKQPENSNARGSVIRNESAKADETPFLMEELERVYLNKTFSVSVDILFNTLLGDQSPFMEAYLEDLDAYDIHFGQWGEGEEQFSGHTVRKFDYKVKSSNVFIKSGFVTTNCQQVIYKESEPSSKYTVDNFNILDGMPYSSTFFTLARYSMRALSDQESQLK